MQSKDLRLATERDLENSIGAATAPLDQRLEDLEVSAGFTPGDINDTTTASLIRNQESDTHSELSAAIGGSVAPLASQVAALSGAVSTTIKSSTVGRIIAIPETDPTPALNDGDMLVRYFVPGASFFTNFGGDTVGAAPGGWTSRWSPSDTWLVESDATAAGGKVLAVAPSSGSRFGLSWDAPTADADAADFEILYRFKRTGNTTSPVAAFGRGSGGALTETAYRGGGRSTTNETVSKYVGGAYTMLTESLQTLTADDWYRSRFRVNGSSLKLKVWLDSDTEPTEWTEGTDTTISAKGWIGLVTTESGKQIIDWVAVGTGGRTAVKP